jgi:hypothetical protein
MRFLSCISCTWPSSQIEEDCGQRAAKLADRIAQKKSGNKYALLSAAMCWDSMLICATLAQAVTCEEVSNGIAGRNTNFNLVTNSGRTYDRVFDTARTFEVQNEAGLDNIPPGSFIGFIDGNENRVRHAMIYIGGGLAAGNKNDCVLSAGSMIGWEKLDLRPFFGADATLPHNVGTYMVCRPVEGQTI